MKILIYVLIFIGCAYALYYGSQHKVDVTGIVAPKTKQQPPDVKTDTDIRDAVRFVR